MVIIVRILVREQIYAKQVQKELIFYGFSQMFSIGKKNQLSLSSRFIFMTYSDQKVIVVCDFSERMSEVVVHGARMADILKKELCLFALWKDKSQKTEVQEKLILMSRNLKSQLPDLQVSNLILRKTLLDNIEKLVNDYNSVLVVLHQEQIKNSMKAFRESSIPFLFIKGSSAEYLQYKNVLVPVDYRKASKETSLWASYLGRFNRSQIQVIFARETNRDDETRLMRNVKFFQKFLSSLNVRHSLVEGNSSSWGICTETLENAQKLKGDVMIFSGSSTITLIDLMIGLPEKRIVQKAGNLPVMLINPRKDICMICD